MSVDWKGKGGVVSEGFEPENLDVSKEFVLELIEMEYLENQTVTFQGDSRQVDRFKTVWMVEGHQTKVWQWFNLPVGFLNGAAVNDRANVVLFAKRAGHPVQKGEPFMLSDHFVEHMRVRCYLEKQKEGSFYRIDMNTVIPYTQQRITPPSVDRIAGLKKLVGLYPERSEALKVYNEIPGGNDAEFSMVWDAVQAGRAEAAKATAAALGVQKPNGPVIDADKQQAQALANGNGKPGQ